MAQFEAPLDSIARGLELGKKHGAMTILNPAPGQRADPELLAHVDVLTPNESETRILLGLPPDDPTPTFELAGRLLDLGVERIVVTRGEQGAVIVTRGPYRRGGSGSGPGIGRYRGRRQLQRGVGCRPRRGSHSARRRLPSHLCGGLHDDPSGCDRWPADKG